MLFLRKIKLVMFGVINVGIFFVWLCLIGNVGYLVFFMWGVMIRVLC